MDLVLLAVVLLLSLLTVPIGLPGLWLMICSAFVFNWLAPSREIGTIAILVACFFAIVAEVLEWTLSAKYTTKYGGSRRASWGAILGGIAGAMIGIPVPVIGSVIGAFAGAFAGALVMEFTRPEATGATATRVATGALLGRVAAAVAKTSLGVAVAVTLLLSAWSS